MTFQATADPPRILSIQSQLVYGCAGNNAAVPLLQALGATVYAVPSILLSNTPHYKTVAAHEFPAEDVDALLQTTLDRMPPQALDAILVGYMRDPRIVSVVAAFIDLVRRKNPAIVVLIDPVMGDTDLGMYVPEEVSERLCDELVPRADICTPNVFEAGVITGCREQPASLTLSRLSELDLPIKLATGIDLEVPGGSVRTKLWYEDQAWIVSTPRIPIRPTGTGDLLSAAFLYYWLVSRSAPDVLQKSVALVHALLMDAVKRGLPELQPWNIRDLPAADKSLVQITAL